MNKTTKNLATRVAQLAVNIQHKLGDKLLVLAYERTTSYELKLTKSGRKEIDYVPTLILVLQKDVDNFLLADISSTVFNGQYFWVRTDRAIGILDGVKIDISIYGYLDCFVPEVDTVILYSREEKS